MYLLNFLFVANLANNFALKFHFNFDYKNKDKPERIVRFCVYFYFLHRLDRPQSREVVIQRKVSASSE